MAVRIETIADLLAQKAWDACAELAAKAFTQDDLAPEQKAFLHYALCRSYSNLERYRDALQPGQLAIYLAEEIKDYELLGRSILEVAWVQHKIPGMERWAVDTQQRYFAFYPFYKELKDRYVTAQYNLGVYLRAGGQYEEAFLQFKTAYQEGRKRGENRVAHLARSNAVWEALRLERLTEAEALIQQGQGERLDDPQLRAAHLLDQAQLALLKGNMALACHQAMRAAVECRHLPDLLARSVEVLHVVADRQHDGELALVAGVFAKVLAESDDRQDIVAQVSGSIRSLALRYPEAVERLMATLDGRA